MPENTSSNQERMGKNCFKIYNPIWGLGFFCVLLSLILCISLYFLYKFALWSILCISLYFLGKSASGHSIILYKDEAQKEFFTGIQCLDRAVKVLYQAEINTTTPARTVKVIAQNLRLPIRQAHTRLTAVLNFWEGEKARQCEETERLISSIRSLKINVSERKMKVELMNQQLQGLSQQITDSEHYVQQAKMHSVMPRMNLTMLKES